MKKKLLLTVAALFTVYLCTWAQSGTCGENLTWSIQDGTLTISGTGEMDSYSESNVPWYNYRDGINNIVINNGVTSIGDNAFTDCANIKTVSLPSSLNRIGHGAFARCSELVQMNLPETIKSIGGSAFEGCDKLVEIENDFGYIGNWAVNYFLNEAVAPCKFRPNTIGVAEYICRDAKFSSIIFPEGFRYIGGWTFAGCRELKFIVIPESVEKINHATFLGCSNLEDVYCMSPTPPAMGSEYTFNELSKEALLHVPDPAAYEDWEPYFAAVERQNTLASGTCGENANWSLTNGVLTINGTGDMESYYLENGEDRHGPWHALKEQIYHVIIDEGITSVGDYAFYDQPEIISVSLPSTLKRIGWSAFNACTGLTGVDLPEGLEQVCPDAFYLCYSLLKEENGVNYVDDWAVSVASDNLTTIPLRPNTIGISDRFAVYKDFTNLKSVNFPKNLKYIGEEAFFYAGCTNLQNVSIPATITHIGARAFANCPGLRRVVCMNPTAITIDGGVFAADESNVSSATLYVKDPSAYEDWKPYFSQCSAMDELAMGKCGENAYWLIEDGTLTVYGTGDMESFYYEVDRFGPWYAHKDKFTKVIIEEGITNLSDYALARLDQITSVSLPSTLTSIAWCAFEGCAQLEGLAIPESVKNVGAYAFDGCDKLVEVENNIGYVGTWAVCATDQSLSSYTLRDNTTGIAGRVFYANETMTTFEFPEGVKYISMEGVGCKNLKSITLPTTIEQIAYVAFGGCSNLSEVICMSPTPPALEYAAFWTINEDATLRVPNASVYESWRPWFKTIIGENVIQGKCGDNLNWVIKDGTLVISGTGKMYDYYPDAPEDRHGPWYDYKDKFDKVVVKDGVTSLGFYAFCYSDNIVSVSLPNSLTEIQGNAFSHCPQLETINIPESVSYLAGGNFIDSPKVQEEENGILYVDSWVMGVTDHTETRAYTIRENTVGIIQNAFLGTQLNGVSFPSTLKYIGADAFAHCPNLTEVRIPATVEKIEEHVFDGCYNLVKVTFDASTPPTEVGNKKFYGLHKDATLYVPRPSAYAGWEVFFGGGIKSTLGDNLFHNGIYFAINEEERSATVTLTPEDAADYAGNIDIPNTITSNGNTYTVTGIGMRAFIDCKELTSVTLPSSVKYIGIEAFTHCENLESINLPEGLTSIGESAFSNCNKLAAIAFPQSLTEISGNAFSACTSLQTITIPSGVKGLWQDAFAWCTSLTSVTLSEGLESIGIQTFLGCKQLTEITIPESVKKIDHQAFKMCDNLLKVTLPDGLEEMGNYVFAACYNMKSINTPSVLKGFPEGTFYDCCALENVKIPAASETIAVNTFWNCQSLKAVDIPESVVRIDNGAFFMTGLNSIEIPASVTYIGEQAFVNCNVLSAVIVNWERPITISSLVFREKEDSKNTIDKLYVPAGAKSAYKVSTAWSVFENIIEANLGNYFAVNDKKVNAGTSFTLPIEMVNKDEVSAFQCDIYLPEGITLQKLNARKYDVKLSEERKEDHTINVSKLSDGAVRVLVISMTSSSIIGNDGELFMLNLSAANEEIGDYTMQIKNIRISDTKGIRHDLNEVKATITLTTSGTSTDFTPADVNNDGMVAVDDVVLTINAALGIISDKFVFAAADMNGDGEIFVDDVVKVINHVLGINTSNAANVRQMERSESLSLSTYDNGFGISATKAVEYTAMQFDMTLPEGLELKDVRFTGNSNHKTYFREMGNGVVRTIVLSLGNELFDGNELLDICIESSADAEVHISNACMVARSGAVSKITDMKAAVGRTSTGLEIVQDGASADIYDTNGRLVKKNALTVDGLRKGIYVINGKKMIVK